MVRRWIVLVSCAALVLLTSCSIEDELEIRADGSGTYIATITVERLTGPVLERIRAEAERDGFRIVDQGETLTRRYVVIRKDFTNIRELSGAQSNFDLKMETRRHFWRRYHLRATVASVAGASFDRRFTIMMPATVKTTTAGNNEGPRVTWYCANGGTIDVVAEGLFIASGAWWGAAGLLVLLGGATTLLRRRQSRDALQPAVEQGVCTTCNRPMPLASRYCPACGDRVLAAEAEGPHRPAGFP